ncbi:sensory box histidine kinase/response regulator [hydrothermal vent metagenome]|uniref:histidine kinase n=1 Tax=hydrothermal vent metagenome TaxID=652676 RepID=A0A3B0ZPD6_9ZZZZ
MKDFCIESTSTRITRSIALGFGTIVVIVTTLTLVFLHQLNELSRNTKQIVNINGVKTELIYQLRDAIRLRALSLQIMAGTNDYFLRDEEKQRFYSYATRYRLGRIKLDQMAMNAEEKKLHVKLVALTRKVQPYNRRAVALLTSNESKMKVNKAVNRAKEGQFKLLEYLDQLRIVQNNLSQIAIVNTKNSLSRSISIAVICIFLGILIAYIAYRKVSGYVNKNTIFLHNKNKELEYAYHKAEEATKVKSSFLANMSHEIRTPLNGMLGMLQLLNDTNMDAHQQQYISTASSSADILLALINDILDLSKIEAGKLSLEKTTFDIESIIESCCTFHALSAQDNGVELACELHKSIPRYLLGDPVRVQQIISNLISNAVKFTKQGSIKVSVKLEDTNSEHVKLAFSVEDTGIGIPIKAQQDLFKVFTQADNSVTRKYGGTGLGLTICRQLVRMMYGELEVFSVPGEGTCFSFSLELGVSEKNNGVDAVELCHSKALIVGSRELSTNISLAYLEEAGVTCERVHGELINCDQAFIDSLQSYDYLIVDIPSIFDESKVADCLKTVDASMDGQIIILCDIKSKQFEEMVKRSDSTIKKVLKPVHKQELYQSLVKCVTTDVERERIEKEEENKFESEVYTVLLVEDNFVNQMVTQSILDKFGHKTFVANDGKEAVEFYEQQKFDIILMDCQMPVMDGFTATKKIREIEACSNTFTPIIALTANVNKEDQARCIEAGMNDFLAKPFKLEVLKEKLDCIHKLSKAS